jgi:DNA polymerase elongation subunit (family B)
MDVASYYPNLIINNGFYPSHLGPRFIEVLKTITKERMQAKKDGDKVKADGLKITINSIFGKLGYEYFWLFDAKQFISTTVNGQLGLLMLIEQLYLGGINVISANTDGVVCSIPRELEATYYKIAKEWEKKTGLELEFTPYKKYIRRDVNSYITEKPDGDTKEKIQYGCWLLLLLLDS